MHQQVFKLDGDTPQNISLMKMVLVHLRIYSLVSGTRTYLNSTAGTIDYTNGIVNINALKITAVSNVDGESSTTDKSDCNTKFK